VRAELAGDARRYLETVRGLDFVVVGSTPAAAREELERMSPAPSSGAGEWVVRLGSDWFARVHVTTPDALGLALVLHTGPESHVTRLSELARQLGRELSQMRCPDEAGVYAQLGLPFVPPELRDADGDIPRDLLELSHIRGAVHCHTTYSDGRHGIEEMARAAQALGHEYITVTDHSPSAHYARGVTLDRLKQQWDEIARVQERVDLKILRGTECDILADGALDYPDAVLEQFDVIIASIHSRFKLDHDAMTQRLLTAMQLPVFKIWGHALGRLVMRREPIACDVPRVLDAVARSRAAIEINADPYRLDLAPEWIPLARERRIPFVVSTDAHSVNGLRVLHFGVGMARRGGLTRNDVLNTRSASEFLRAVRPV
jgi:DNA polymerase (family 10)